jgi:hypothetical protein
MICHPSWIFRWCTLNQQTKTLLVVVWYVDTTLMLSISLTLVLVDGSIEKLGYTYVKFNFLDDDVVAHLHLGL